MRASRVVYLAVLSRAALWFVGFVAGGLITPYDTSSSIVSPAAWETRG